MAQALRGALVVPALLWIAATAVAGPETCEFRVLQWNASGNDHTCDEDVAVGDAIVAGVAEFDANVATLQEVTDATRARVEAELPGWSCYSAQFSWPDESIAICVEGGATNFTSAPLSGVRGTDCPAPACPTEDSCLPPDWWGYVRVDYEGVRITSTHTRSTWADNHLAELHDLHENVTSGILGGDLNYSGPLPPGWFQTDPSESPTHGDAKIDHVVAIGPPQSVSGFAGEAHGSNHKMVFGSVSFQEEPRVAVEIAGTGLPIEVDGGCSARVAFEIALHDNCCLDPDELALAVTASNPTANATLGPVVIDSVVALGPRDVRASGHVSVSALRSCPAEIAIEATARDCFDNEGEGNASVQVLDSTPPEVGAFDGDLYCLWPPAHRYVCFDAGQFAPEVTDNCVAPSWAFAACTSDQPDNGLGTGQTASDCVLDADAQGFCARAERAGGTAAGRRYALEVVASDACGNSSAPAAIGGVRVPHSGREAAGGMCLAP